MEKVSAVGLASFAARCRRRAAPWKEAESSEDVGSCRRGAGDTTMGSSGCSTVMIRQMLLCVCVSLRPLHFFFIRCGYLPPSTYFYSMSWRSATLHREQSPFVRYPRHPHPPAFRVAAGYFQGKFQALAAVGQCHEHPGTALSTAVSSCLSSLGGTPGLFLLRVLIALANYTDVGGVDSRLNVSHRARTVGKKAGWAL